MRREILRITQPEINTSGAVYNVSGVWNDGLMDRPFFIKLHCEYDGRDVDSETPAGGYNPMENWDGESPEFFNEVLCQDERFTKLHSEGYAIWEKLNQAACAADEAIDD